MAEEYKLTNKISKEVIKEIIEIKDQVGLTAEEVLNRAKKKKSALHNLFIWDNDVAAEKYRLHQARMLINEVKVIVDTKEYYAFENVSIGVSDSSVEGVSRQYFGRAEILSSEVLRRQVLERAFSNILYWKQQYESYEEFKPIVRGIREVEVFMGREREKLKGGVVDA